jgi:hypothetical protein
MKIYKIGLMAVLLATTAIPVEAREKPWFRIDKGCGTRCLPPQPTFKLPPFTYATIITVPRTVWYEKNGRVVPREESAYTHYVRETNTYYEPLKGGALRIPPGGQTPPGYYMAPAEDLMEGSGWIAIPDGGSAPGSKLVTLYRSDGLPVQMGVPSYWDPSKIKFECHGTISGSRMYPKPPEHDAVAAVDHDSTVGAKADPEPPKQPQTGEPRSLNCKLSNNTPLF